MIMKQTTIRQYRNDDNMLTKLKAGLIFLHKQAEEISMIISQSIYFRNGSCYSFNKLVRSYLTKQKICPHISIFLVSRVIHDPTVPWVIDVFQLHASIYE